MTEEVKEVEIIETPVVKVEQEIIVLEKFAE